MKRPRQPKPKVKESEARYRRLLDMLPDAILIYCGGKCVFANPAAARLFGAASPKEMLGLDVIDLTPSGLPGIRPTKDQFSLWRKARATSGN